MRVPLWAASLTFVLVACAGAASPDAIADRAPSPTGTVPTLAPRFPSATGAPDIISLPAKLRLIEFFAGT